MIFKIIGHTVDGRTNTFLFNNMTNELTDVNRNVYAYPQTAKVKEPFSRFFDGNVIKKTVNPRVVKIQLGLSCNYSCSYCLQRFVAAAQETTKNDIKDFMLQLENLKLSGDIKFEFWGGEPLVYWKTLKPLVAAIKERYQGPDNNISLSTVTNGSLLTEEIADWLYNEGFSVGISHDGPNQALRGPDPFVNNKEIVLNFYKKMKPENRISFNSMLSKNQMSRKAIFDWFVEFTGDPKVVLSEGTIIEAYDEGGVANSLITDEDHFMFRQTGFNDIYSNMGNIGFQAVVGKINELTQLILTQTSIIGAGMKCGMDRPDIISVDLKGNVITCQNVSSVAIAPNGKPHLGGTLADISNVKIETSKHWSDRDTCTSCPVVALCKGACMFLEGHLWETTCNNSFSDNVALFALALERITGFIPVYIDADHLPENRKNIWGTYQGETHEN